MHILVMLMNFLRHVLSLIILLRYFQESLSGIEVKMLPYFLIALLSSLLEKRTHVITFLSGSSSKSCRSIWQFWAELKDMWSALNRSSSLLYEQLLYQMALTTRSLYLLTQFMSSQGSYFLLDISWIFESKKLNFDLLTIPLKYFQSAICLVCL